MRYGRAKHRCNVPSLTHLPGRSLQKTRPAGFEPATAGLEIPCSIQLSYGRNVLFMTEAARPASVKLKIVPVAHRAVVRADSRPDWGNYNGGSGRENTRCAVCRN